MDHFHPSTRQNWTSFNPFYLPSAALISVVQYTGPIGTALYLFLRSTGCMLASTWRPSVRKVIFGLKGSNVYFSGQYNGPKDINNACKYYAEYDIVDEPAISLEE